MKRFECSYIKPAERIVFIMKSESKEKLQKVLKKGTKIKEIKE